MSREVSEKMAHNDIFFSLVILGMGIFFSYKNWLESDWLGMAGTLLLALFGGLWFAARVYHLTHKDEVFGGHEQE